MKLAGLLRERLALHAPLGRQAFEARMGEEARRLSKFNFGPEMLQAGPGVARGRGKGERVHAAYEAKPHRLVSTCAAHRCFHPPPPPPPPPPPGRCGPLGTSTPAWDPR